MFESPCKDCQNKGCGAYHDECPEYQEYKIKHEQEKEEIRMKNKAENDYTSIVVERAIKRRNNITRFKQR